MTGRRRSDSEEDRCDRVIRQLGGTVYDFSLGGRTPFPDVPDRRYRVRGVAFWCECKSQHDKFTQGQLEFLKAERACAEVVFAGDAKMLTAMLVSRPSTWRDAGWAALAIVAARGLRKATKTRSLL